MHLSYADTFLKSTRIVSKNFFKDCVTSQEDTLLNLFDLKVPFSVYDSDWYGYIGKVVNKLSFIEKQRNIIAIFK